MTRSQLNSLNSDRAAATLQRCCGSTRWAREMAARRPFATPEELFQAADELWWSLLPDDWREAFAAHPRIGDADATRPVLDTREGAGPGASGVGVGPHAGREWSSAEQSGMASASADVRERLARADRDYEARFGYIFIVCATGKSAVEMLGILESRLSNSPGEELRIAAEEQRAITRLRLEKLLT